MADSVKRVASMGGRTSDGPPARGPGAAPPRPTAASTGKPNAVAPTGEPTAASTGEPARSIRVAIVDDHPVVREGTAALLEREPGLVVVGTAGRLDEAGDLLDPERVDVLLLDIRLGVESGLELLRSGRPGSSAALPAVVVVTAYDYPQYVDAALRLGAAGLVLKTAPLSELVEAIRRAAAGGLAFERRPGGGSVVRLTARERDVVRLLVDGRTNDEIGAALGIGARTVETHLRRLFERLDCASRTELVARALREGWLEVPD
jgi:DNA-binding NarL/FixJ family response regulator